MSELKTKEVLENKLRQGLSYLENKEFDKALELFNTVFNCATDENVKDQALSNIASVYIETGKGEEAKNIDEKLYKKRLDNLGENDASTLCSMSNLIDDYIEINNLDKAKALLIKYCDLTEKVYGEYNEEVIKGYENLCHIYKQLKNYKEAIDLSEQLYKIKKIKYGQLSSEAKWALNFLLELCVFGEDNDKEQKYLNEIKDNDELAKAMKKFGY